jgi:hypothetical protein
MKNNKTWFWPITLERGQLRPSRYHHWIRNQILRLFVFFGGPCFFARPFPLSIITPSALKPPCWPCRTGFAAVLLCWLENTVCQPWPGSRN